MNLNKFLSSSILMLVFTGLLSLNSPGYCATQSKTTLNQKLKQTNDKRYYITKKKQQTDLKLKNERNKLSNNQQKLEKTKTQLDNSTKKYNNIVSDLSQTEKKLTQAVNEFKDLDKDMKLRIRQVFKHQRPGMFELILTAGDINTVLDNFYYEKIVLREDYKRIQRVKAKADEIARLKSEIEAQKRMLAASIRDINNQKASIQNSIAVNKSMIERLNKDKSYYEKTERELARQSANIQSMIAGMTSVKGSAVKVSSTGFIRPIRGPITSPFGYRIHPIFKSRIFHSGIDIGGPNGGSIVASNDGKVIYSGWYGGYGKVVILDHGVINGKPITTLYAHMSSISVSNGQMVKKGQTVGREGSTGYSTGPHCHFEVRVNGQPTNPMNYI